MYLITGLGALEGVPKGCFALARKVHHGQFDGTNIMRLSKRLHSAEPSADEWSPERTPSGIELLMRAPLNRTRRLWKGAGVLGQNVPRLVDMITSPDEKQAPPEEKRPIPRTRFCHSIGSRKRVFDGHVFPLEEAKALRRHVAGATLNDVALTICTGAIRKYLMAHDELPDDPLIIGVPVSAHTEDESEEEGAGNRISFMFVTLHTEVADPLERLRLVCASTGRSKQTSEQIGAGNVADMLDIIPTYLLGPGIQTFIRLGLAEYLPLPMSGISITNVPGPREPSYFNGSRLVGGCGCPFLFDGVGLIIAVSSYCDDFLIHFGSTPEMIPDPDFFLDCIREAWDEFVSAG